MPETSTLQPRITEAPQTTAVPRVLLLSSVPPNTTYTGALMLHEMFAPVPKDRLSCFAVMTSHLDPSIHSNWAEINYKSRKKPDESHIRHFPGALGGIESLIIEQYIRLVNIPRLADEIIEFARENGVEKIWCTVEGQTLIRLADIIQKKTSLPMVAQVWDPPGWWMRDNHVDFISRKEILKTFERVMNKAETVAAASWAMAEEYEKLYGAKAIPVVPGLPNEWAFAPQKQRRNSETFKIGFAGQMYSSGEWNTLIRTLESVEWTLDGRPVEIIVLGRSCQFNATSGSNINYRGWRSQKDSISILSDCDILYCPYWFDSDHETEARLSFPSKLTTYLAAGRPVLFHGPSYASPAKFLAKYHAAVQCNEQSQSALAGVLQKLAKDPEFGYEIATNGTIAFNANLTSDRMQEQFCRSLGIS